jgi:hypothetical protein
MAAISQAVPDSALHRLYESNAIPDVAEEVAHFGAGEFSHLPHLELLVFVAGEHNQAARLVAWEDRSDEGPAERPGAAGHENRFVIEH